MTLPRLAHPGNPGDARVGTVYGRRNAAEYNRVKIACTEIHEGRKMTLLHFARKIKNDDYVSEFVVINGHLDPGMKVYSRVAGTDPNTQPLAFTGDPAKGTVRPFTWLDAVMNGYKGEFMPLPDEQVVEEWPRTEEDGRYVFHAPPSYKGGPIVWLHRADLGDEALVYESGKHFLFPVPGRKQDINMTEVGSGVA
jgi:hypothetical protein